MRVGEQRNKRRRARFTAPVKAATSAYPRPSSDGHPTKGPFHPSQSPVKLKRWLVYTSMPLVSLVIASWDFLELTKPFVILQSFALPDPISLYTERIALSALTLRSVTPNTHTHVKCQVCADLISSRMTPPAWTSVSIASMEAAPAREPMQGCITLQPVIRLLSTSSAYGKRLRFVGRKHRLRY